MKQPNIKAPKYDSPTPLLSEDLKKLRDLDSMIWMRSKDRFGHTHAFPVGFAHKDNRAMSKADQTYVLEVIGKHVLPCVMGSGPYGELSFQVYNHTEIPEIPPERVISLSEEHFGLRGDNSQWKARWDEMAKVTHSPRNREVLAFYKLPEPGPAGDYDY